MEKRKYALDLNIQYFAEKSPATFTPDNVVMSDALAGAVPGQYSELVIEEILSNSAVMQLAKYQEMDGQLSKQFSYLTDGPGAFWVGEGQRIETSKATWVDVEMVAKKLAVIIPVTNEALMLSRGDFFDQYKPLIAEAFYAKLDQAALFGTDTPFAAGNSVLEAAQSAGNTVAYDDAGNMYTQLNGVLGLIEDEEIDPNAIVTGRSMKTKFRGVLDEVGRPIFTKGDGTAPDDVLGLPLVYPSKKSFDKTKAVALAGDWDKVFYGIPQAMTYKIATEGTISSIVGEDGEPINLLERDMQAMRVTMHVAFLVVQKEAFAALTPDVTP